MDVFADTARLEMHAENIGLHSIGTEAFLEEEAANLGISLSESLKRSAITEEHIEKMRKENEFAQRRVQSRLKAVAEAYWNASDPDFTEFSPLYRAIKENSDISEPTIAQQKALFLMLPGEIIGAGITHGFSDSVVRGDIIVFVGSNADDIIPKILGVKD